MQGVKCLLTYLLKLLGASIKTVDTLKPCGDGSSLIFTSTIINNAFEWDAEETWAEGIDKIKRIINKLLTITDVSAKKKSYSEVILGSMEVIDTMYSKIGIKKINKSKFGIDVYILVVPKIKKEKEKCQSI